MTEVVARLTGIERRFGSVTALDGADLELRAGEVHGVLGANGAGKTTLLYVLGGMLRPDAGKVVVGGSTTSLSGPRDAWAHGIALVHQHFTLVPALSVLENLTLGHRGRHPLALPTAQVESAAQELMERTGLSVPLRASVDELGVGDKQRAEILKALLRDPRVLILDEPTQVLAPSEIEGLFALLRGLAREGRAIALVAHKLDEVLGVADRLTVLRSGRTVLSTPRSESDEPSLVRAMVGGEVADEASVGWLRTEPTRDASDVGETVASLHAVSVRTAGRATALDDVSLDVRRGEIVGVAGVEGNGQHELALVLSGRIGSVMGRADLPPGIGFIPQDRTTEGLVAEFDLTENLALALHREVSCRDGIWLRWDEIQRRAGTVRERYEVGAPSLSTPAGQLSGGNQQRLVVGRELAMATDLLVAENPTRGLDVKATAFVHDELRRVARGSAGVVLVSTDLDEVLALSDRVFAMHSGHLVAVPDDRRTREGVGALMLGGGRASA